MNSQQQSQLIRQMNMLRQYSKVLQAQNRSRNQQRLILQQQISRLLSLQKQWKSTSNTNLEQCQECTRYKSEILKLNNQVERLTRQNTNLQASNNLLSETLTKNNLNNNNNINNTSTARIITLKSSSTSNSQAPNNTPQQLQNLTAQLQQNHKKIEQLSATIQKLTKQATQNKKLLQYYKQNRTASQNLQKSISELQLQKQTLNIRISSLELELHNMKKIVSEKDSEIFGYKAKLGAVNTSTSTITVLSGYNSSTGGLIQTQQLKQLKQQLKQIKQQLKTKQHQINNLNEQLTAYKSHPTSTTPNKNIQLQATTTQLTLTKTILQAKQKQLTTLRAVLLEKQQQSSKIYKLQAEIRNLKYQMTSKDTELQSLKNRINQVQIQEKTKINGYLGQIRSIRDLLDERDKRIFELVLQSQQTQGIKQQITALQNQNRNLQQKYQQQLKSYKLKDSVQPVTNTHQPTQQTQNLLQQLSKTKQESSQKDTYIASIQQQIKLLIKHNQQQNYQVQRFDKIVNSYINKINQLQMQLNKLQKNPGNCMNATGSFRMQESVNQSHITGVMENNQIIILKEENKGLEVQVKEYQSQIQRYKEDNYNLHRQLQNLKVLYNQKQSRVVIKEQIVEVPVIPNQQLVETIKLLKEEIDDTRVKSQKIKHQNQAIKRQFQKIRKQSQRVKSQNQALRNEYYDIRSQNQRIKKQNERVLSQNQKCRQQYQFLQTKLLAAQVQIQKINNMAKISNEFAMQMTKPPYSGPPISNVPMTVSIPMVGQPPPQPIRPNIISFHNQNAAILLPNSPKSSQIQRNIHIQKTSTVFSSQNMPNHPPNIPTQDTDYILQSPIQYDHRNLNIITTNKILSVIPSTQIPKQYPRQQLQQKQILSSNSAISFAGPIGQGSKGSQKAQLKNKAIDYNYQYVTQNNQNMQQIQLLKLNKMMSSNASVSILDETQRDPFTSQIIRNNNAKMRALQAQMDVQKFQKPWKAQKQRQNLKQRSEVHYTQRQYIPTIVQNQLNSPQGHILQNIPTFKQLVQIRQHNEITQTNPAHSSMITYNQPQLPPNFATPVVLPSYQNPNNKSNSNSSAHIGQGRKTQLNQLQKKIQMLKRQNKGLRKHLYQE